MSTPNYAPALSPGKATLNPTPFQILGIETSRSPTRLTLGPTPTKLLNDIYPTFAVFTRNPTPLYFQGQHLRIGGDDDASLVEVSTTYKPTSYPTLSPTNTIAPTTDNPTSHPSYKPTNIPTLFPTTSTIAPTLYPTEEIVVQDVLSPTSYPVYDPTNTPTLFPTTPTFAPTFAPTQNVEQDVLSAVGIALTTVFVLLIICCCLCIYGFCFGFADEKKEESMPLLPELPSLPSLPDFKPPELDFKPPNCMPSVSGCLQRLRGKGKKGKKRGDGEAEEEDEDDEEEVDDGGGFVVTPSEVPGEDTQKLVDILSYGKDITLYTSKGPRKVQLKLADNKELRWELPNTSSGPKKYKLDLIDVLHVQIGKSTKNLKEADVSTNLCLSLIFQSITLDIVATSHEERDSMVHGFNEIVDNLKEPKASPI